MKVTFNSAKWDSVGLYDREEGGLIFVLGKTENRNEVTDTQLSLARREIYESGYDGARKPDEEQEKRIALRSKRIRLARCLCHDETVDELAFYIGETVDGDTAHTEQSPHVRIGELSGIRLELVRVWADSAERRHNGWF